MLNVPKFRHFDLLATTTKTGAGEGYDKNICRVLMTGIRVRRNLSYLLKSLLVFSVGQYEVVLSIQG